LEAKDLVKACIVSWYYVVSSWYYVVSCCFFWFYDELFGAAVFIRAYNVVQD